MRRPLQTRSIRTRDALADADAHRRDRALAPPVNSKLRDRGRLPALRRHAKRMADRDGAAIRVHVLGIVGEPKAAHNRETLRGEGFVQLDDIDI